MATTIDLQWVSAVLLSDGWHVIQPGTFQVEEYRFSSGAAEPQQGFSFVKVDQLTRNVQHYVGPLSYVHGIRYDVPTEVVEDEE